MEDNLTLIRAIRSFVRTLAASRAVFSRVSSTRFRRSWRACRMLYWRYAFLVVVDVVEEGFVNWIVRAWLKIFIRRSAMNCNTCARLYCVFTVLRDAGILAVVQVFSVQDDQRSVLMHVDVCKVVVGNRVFIAIRRDPVNYRRRNSCNFAAEEDRLAFVYFKRSCNGSNLNIFGNVLDIFFSQIENISSVETFWARAFKPRVSSCNSVFKNPLVGSVRIELGRF